jgi:hypothetical protein
MVADCDAPPVTRWWGYAIVFVVFALALFMWSALIYAEKRVFPDTVKLYTLPTVHVHNRPLPRRVPGAFYFPH